MTTDLSKKVVPERPAFPDSYGVKSAAEGRLLEWSMVETQLIAARNYWVATVSHQGNPHAAPVWGVWHQGAFYFGADLKSRKALNLETNNAIVVHLESGDEVVILEGVAHLLQIDDLSEELDAAYFQKYGVHLKGNPVFRVEIRKAFAWSEGDFPDSATRWQFHDLSPEKRR